MTTGNPHDSPSDHASSGRSQDTVVSLHDAARPLRRMVQREISEDRRTTADFDEILRAPTEVEAQRRDLASAPKKLATSGLADALTSLPEARTGAPLVSNIVALPIPSPPTASDHERGSFVRRRINAAARPILEAYARSRGLLSNRMQRAIAGSMPLAHPAVARELGGALHSDAMRTAISANADSGLVPLKVRADLAKLSAQDLANPPPSTVAEGFPDWNKPLAPAGQHHPAWHAKDAATWLKHFPPSRHLPQPLDIWDDATAALWLNDRASIVPAPQDGDGDDVVVAIDASNPWKPSLEVLHTLDEIELEELAYRVFVERLRREVMPFHVSERRLCVQNAILLITFGYRTLEGAQRHVHENDLKRIRHFDRLFGTDREWINDLCCRILDICDWPDGFSESEIQSKFD